MKEELNMKLVGCTDAKTYASMCDICHYEKKGNECEHADKVKLYDGEDTTGYRLIGCRNEKEFFMCSMCLCTPEGANCKKIQEMKVFKKL